MSMREFVAAPNDADALFEKVGTRAPAELQAERKRLGSRLQ